MGHNLKTLSLTLALGTLTSPAYAADAEQSAPAPTASSTAPAATSDQAGAPQTDAIIVTAQRRAENLARTPVSVSVVSSEALQRQAIVSEADLQVAVPGLLVKAGSTSDQLNYAIRGQSLDAFSNVEPGVLPYFNEVQISSGGSSAFFDLQSVQVLKGPQGTLFGRNATGGAVLFTTTKPSNDFGGYLTLRAGNYAAVQGEGALNVPLVTDKVLLRVAGFYERRRGFQYNTVTQSSVGDVRRRAGRLSLTIKPNANLSNDLVVDYLNSGGSSINGVIDNIYPTGSTNAPAPANFLFTPAIDSLFGPGAFASYVAAHPYVDPLGIVHFTDVQHKRGPYIISIDSPAFYRAKNLIMSNITTLQLGGENRIRNIIGLTRLKSKVGADFDGSPFDVDQRGAIGSNINTHQFSDELQIIGKALDRKLDYVAGVYYSNEKVSEYDLSAIFDLAPLLQPTNQINSGVTKRRSYAAYAQGTLDLGDLTKIRGLSVIAGARYTVEKVSLLHRPDDVFVLHSAPNYVTPQSDKFKKISWQFGLQEQVNPSLMIYATTRRSFRSGGFNFFAAPIVGLGNSGGSEYALEQATDVELGAKYQGHLGGVPARFNIAAYNLWIDNIQRATYVQIAGSPGVITVNVPKTKIQGAEFDAFIRPASWLSLGGSLNYTDAKFTSNLVKVLGNPAVAFGPFPDVAKWSGNVYADISAPVGPGLRSSLRGDYYSQSSTYYSSTADTLNPGTKLPGYGLFNLRAGLDSDKGWSVAAIVKNVTNKVYYVGGFALGSLFTLNTVLPGSPRTFLGEVRFRF